MMDTIALAVLFVALAGAAFVLAVRVGMLLGLRLGRALEKSYSADSPERPGAAVESSTWSGEDDVNGREENRVE